MSSSRILRFTPENPKIDVTKVEVLSLEENLEHRDWQVRTVEVQVSGSLTREPALELWYSGIFISRSVIQMKDGFFEIVVNVECLSDSRIVLEEGYIFFSDWI